MKIEDLWNDWIEVTTQAELAEGRRTFVKGRAKFPAIEVTPAAVDAFERFGTDAYGGIVDTAAGLRAALAELGIPVRADMEYRESLNYPGYFIGRDGCVIGRAGHVLKPRPDAAGYGMLIMCLAGNRRKTIRVHRLVCETFHGERPSPRHVVAHDDGRKRNNCADNLRWATFEENEADKAGHGTRLLGERHFAARLSDDSVRKARTLRAEGISYAKIASRFGVTKRTITQAISGETWGHVQ